jgi:hypothetical protein
MVNAVARLLKTDIEEKQGKFLEDFNEFLKIYFQFPDEDLAKLLEENEERDAFLLDEKLKNQLLHLFANAGLVYVNLNQIEKAEISLKIIERIQIQHSDLFEFPNEESEKLKLKIEKLNHQLNL